MILLLESDPRARDLLEQELARHAEVCAPDLDDATPLGELLAEVLREGRCRLLVLGDRLPGASTASLIRLLRAYLPLLPVVLMRREGRTCPPIECVVGVPYTNFETELASTVSYLLEERDPLGDPRFQAKTLVHSRILARLTAG